LYRLQFPLGFYSVNCYGLAVFRIAWT